MGLKKRFILGVACCLFAAFESTAQSAIKIAVVDAPPYSYLDSYQQPAGKLVDTFTFIAQELALEPEFVYVPHKRQLRLIERGDVDLWAGQKDSRVSDRLAWTSDVPLFEMDLCVFWHSDAQAIKDFSELKEKQLILISSYSYGGRYDALVDGALSVTYAINHEDALDKLHANPSAYMLGYSSIANAIQQKYQLDSVERHVLDNIPLHAKLSTRFPNAEELIQTINEILATRDAN